MTIAARPGTYAIALYAGSCTGIRVGRLGRVRIERGYYVYVGSAFGPGGVRARVSRHLRDSKTRRWHIDYLREVATPVCIWCSYEPLNLEHQWARAVGDMPGISGIEGFGSSDCGCSTHLFFRADEARPHPLFIGPEVRRENVDLRGARVTGRRGRAASGTGL